MIVKLDKKTVNKYKLGQEPKDRLYWLSVSAEERLKAAEFLRAQIYSNDDLTSGFKRIYRIVKQK